MNELLYHYSYQNLQNLTSENNICITSFQDGTYLQEGG